METLDRTTITIGRTNASARTIPTTRCDRDRARGRDAGESERDELNDMLENLASARHWAMRMGAAEKKDAAAAPTRNWRRGGDGES